MRRSSLALSILDGTATPPIPEQLSTVRWAGVLCAPIGPQAGWAFQLVYASPLLLSSGLNATQVASVWFAYTFLSLMWRMLIPCHEADATDVPRARRDLATGTLVASMGLIGLGKIDGLANQLARLGGGVGDWDPVRIDARVGAGQAVLVSALGVLDVGLQRMGYAAHALVVHVPQAWIWASQTSHHPHTRPIRAHSWAPGAVSHIATIAGFLLAGLRLNTRPGSLLDWVLAPPADPEEESACDSQVRRLSAGLVILLWMFGSIAWCASGPPIKPPESPMEPESPLPPPPPVPRRGGARTNFWTALIPEALRPSPRGGVKRAVAQVGEAIRAKAMSPGQRKVYVAQLLMIAAWSPLVWFGSTFGLLVQRGYEKDRRRFRPGPPSFLAVEAIASQTNSTGLDIPSIAWSFAGFALISALTSCAVYYVTTRPMRASLRACTFWTLAAHLASAGLIASLWVRTPVQTDILLSVLAIPWSLLSVLPNLLSRSFETPTSGCAPEQDDHLPRTPSASSSPAAPGINIHPRAKWPGTDSRPASDQQRLSWRSSIIRANQEDIARTGSQQSARTSAVTHATHPPPASATTMPMPIPSSQEDVRPPEALARAREMQAGFAFRPTDEGVSPASVSFSSPALRTTPLPGTQGRSRENLPLPRAENEHEDLPRKFNNSSDSGSSPPRSSIDEESLTSSFSTNGAHHTVAHSFLTSTPPQGATASAAQLRRPVTPPSPIIAVPSIRSSSVRGSVRAVETPTKRSGPLSLHSSRATLLEHPLERASCLDEREDGAARQAVANALVHCASLPTRESYMQSSDSVESLKDGTERMAALAPAGPFEMGYHGGVNPRLARLPPLTIVSTVPYLGVRLLMYVTLTDVAFAYCRVLHYLRSYPPSLWRPLACVASLASCWWRSACIVCRMDCAPFSGAGRG